MRIHLHSATLGFLLLGILIYLPANISAGPQNYLKNCFDNQVMPLHGRYLCLTYNESANVLGHDFEPWKQTNYLYNGKVWCDANDFLKSDTLNGKSKAYYSKTQFDKSTLLFQDYGDDSLYPATLNMYTDYILQTARYTPILLINYFYRIFPAPEAQSDTSVAVYKLIIHKTVVRLFIRKQNSLLEKAVMMYNDDMLGDVENTYSYRGYSEIKRLYYPGVVAIDKIGNKVHDEIRISSGTIVSIAPALLNKPSGYSLKDDAETTPEISTEKYNENIYFVNLKHTESKSAIVVLKDFIAVIEDTLSSANGELIINEARKIAPDKPIKYFAFGHHHPWYLGGVRPFIHIGATILTVKDDVPYVEYLASAEHTLQPDSLQLQPKSLKTEEIGMNETITDGDYQMEIYFIGDKSMHTNDYLVFYFPKEKLLLEGDLIWIPQTGEMKKANKRQAGLYNAIKDLGIDVDTIIQHWPIGERYGVKSVIPFGELEESVNIK